MRSFAVGCLACLALLAAAPAALAKTPSVDWKPCADAQGFDGATDPVPLD
jgi:hypothetical protein